MKRPVALSIAGSDPGGGAGIQQDLRVFSVLGVFGCAAVTAITVQNTVGVRDVFSVASSIVASQVELVMEDISPQVVKIGMLSTRENVTAVAGVLKSFKEVFVVADPVMLSKNGRYLLEEAAVSVYIDELLPLVDLLTPNIPEAVRISGSSKDSPDAYQEICLSITRLMNTGRISPFGPAVLLKGGHGPDINVCTDCLYVDGKYHFYESDRLDNPHTHGTGCALSSAVAAFIARGDSLIDAVEKARDVVHQAIKAGFALGKGIGPVDPLVLLPNTYPG